MTQQIDIGVEAKGADAAIKKVSDQAGNAADNLQEATRRANDLNDALKRVQATAERLKSVKSILSRELGHEVSDGDAGMFLSQFDRMRRGRGLGSQRLRAYNDFESWYLGHSGSFKNAGDAARHRRLVMSVGMQGTQYSQSYGAPTPPAPPGPPQPPSNTGGAVNRAGSMALSFTKGMLAVAGIESFMSMIAKGVGSASEEAIGIDTLKRRAGDVGESFGKLENEARSAAEGLGMTYTESARLAQEFVRTAGTLRGVSLQSALRTGYGMGRAFGIDPSEGVAFLSTMRRMGVGGDDHSNKRLALMIADAVQRGGYEGKADEILSAISDFTTTAARLTLSTPNVSGYASALTALTGSGAAGADPAGAAAILNAADSATRRGGGYGEASMNFLYAALNRANPGLDPVSAQAIMSGGLFGTTRQLFGRGTPLARFYGQHGLKIPGLSDVTTLSKEKSLLEQYYGNSPYALNAAQNLWGLQSPQQAALLWNMHPANLDASSSLLGRAGFDLSKLSASGISWVSKVAAANNVSDLTGIYQGVMSRHDVTDGEKDKLRGAYGSGNLDTLKLTLARVVGSHEQEQTEGEKTRKDLADIDNAITELGKKLLDPLNIIKDSIVYMAKMFGFSDSRSYVGSHFEGGNFVNGKYVPQHFVAGHFESKAAQSVKSAAAYAGGTSHGQLPHSWLDRFAANDAANNLPAGSTYRQIFKETGGRFNLDAFNKRSGAMGLAQVMPGTLAGLEKRFGRKLDPYSFQDSMLINRTVMHDMIGKYKDLRFAWAGYDGAGHPGDPKSWNAESRGYVDWMTGNTPVPGGAARSGHGNMHVAFHPATIHLADSKGNSLGRVDLTPFMPSGSLSGFGGAFH